MRINKFVIAAGIGIVIIIALTIVLFIVNRKQTSQSPSNWVSQKTAGYTIAYPKDWQIKLGPIAGGGGTFNKITPLTDSPEKPVIFIQGADATITSIESVSQGFIFFEFENSPITVDGISSTKFFGWVPERLTNPGPNKREIAVVLQKNNTVYLVQLTYFGSQTNKTLEDNFMRMLSEMRFN